MNEHILIVEDDQAISKLIDTNLANARGAVLCAGEGN